MDNKLVDKLDKMISTYTGPIKEILKLSKLEIIELSKENDWLKKTQELIVDTNKLIALCVKEDMCPNDLISYRDRAPQLCAGMDDSDCIGCWKEAFVVSGGDAIKMWKAWKDKCSIPMEITGDANHTWEEADDLVRIK